MFKTKFTLVFVLALVILSGQAMAGNIDISDIYPTDGSSSISPIVHAYVYFADNFQNYSLTINGQQGQMEIFTSDDGRYFLRYDDSSDLIKGLSNNSTVNISLLISDYEGDQEQMDWSYTYVNNGSGPGITTTHDPTTVSTTNLVVISATTDVPAACEFAVTKINSNVRDDPTYRTMTSEFYGLKNHDAQTDIIRYGEIDVSNASIEIRCDDFTGGTSSTTLDYLFDLTAETGDSTEPDQVTGLTAAPFSTSRINLGWSAASDNVAVTGYRIYRDDVEVAITTSTSYADTGLTPSTTYSYKVSAFDAAGNSGQNSSSMSATTTAQQNNGGGESSGGSSGGSSSTKKKSGGGGGSSIGKTNATTWSCSEWLTCVNGKQERVCVSGKLSKTEVQTCKAAPTQALEPAKPKEEVVTEVNQNTEVKEQNLDEQKAPEKPVVKEVEKESNSITGAVLGLARDDKGLTPIGLIALCAVGVALIAAGLYYDYTNKQKKRASQPQKVNPQDFFKP